MFEVISEPEGRAAESAVVFGDLPLELFEGKRVLKPTSLEFSALGGKACVAALCQSLQEAKVKRLVVAGQGADACLVQALAVEARKFTRKLLLVDALTRPSPTKFERIIDWLEEALPLGLPFGKSHKFFDSRSQLYRISCPVLVVTTPDASDYTKTQGELLAARIANAYFSPGTELSELDLSQFWDVPAKLPWKRTG